MGQDASAEQTDVRLPEYRGWFFDFPAVVDDKVVVFIQLICKIAVNTAVRIGFSVFLRIIDIYDPVQMPVGVPPIRSCSCSGSGSCGCMSQQAFQSFRSYFFKSV